MQRRKVLLPEPEGPMMHITSPGCDLEVDAPEHLVPAEALVHRLGRTIGGRHHGHVPSPNGGGSSQGALGHGGRLGAERNMHAPEPLDRRGWQPAHRPLA